MPGHADIIVDTSELAESLKDVNNSLDETTSEVSETNSSVKTMAAAVCAAEAAAAARVSKKVTSGFRGLISVQMAQRKIECYSEVQAKCLQLKNFNDMLAQLNKQLQGDYERITRRYSKILQQLGTALKSRIYSIDAPAAEVADHGYRELINRTLSNAASTILFDQDVQPLSNMIAVVRCKDSCHKSMEKLKPLVLEMRNLRSSLEKFIRNVHVSDNCPRSLPVIIIEHDDLNVANYRKTEIKIGDRKEQKQLLKHVEAGYERQSDRLVWRDDDKRTAALSDKILRLASSADIDERQRSIIRDLIEHNRWQNLEGIR